MSDLSKIILEISKKRKKYHKHHDPRRYISSWIETDVLPGGTKKVDALVIVLRTAGCTWSKNMLRSKYDTNDGNKEVFTGGCTMCGYINDCIREDQRISDDDIIYQFNNALENNKERDYDFVKIFTSGSFLDDSEISGNVRTEILKELNELNMTHFLFESRPEFVGSDKLNVLKSNFSGKLYCSIGLESCNNKILKYSINKGFTFSDYTKAVELCRGQDISIKTYLLLKPPFLSERDACADVVKSIEILKKQKLTDCISINPVNVQNFTLIEYLFERGEYRPPWLWSVVDILQRGSKMLSGSNINLISHPTGGGKRRGAHNCFSCDDSVLNAIKQFSLDNDTKYFDNLNCKCRSNWQDVKKIENIAHSTIIN